MTIPEARKLLDLLFAAFPSPVLDEDSIAVYLAHLCALSRTKGETTVRRLVATQVFLPKVAEIVAAAGIHDQTHVGPDGQAVNSVQQLMSAMAQGVELVPDLASLTGWSIGTAVRPIPAPLVEPAALPPGPPISAERRHELRQRIAGLASGRSVGGAR